MSAQVTNTSGWRRTLTIGCFVAMLPCAGCLAFNFVIFGPSKIRQDRENQVRGEALAATLETYRAANGQYPESLGSLEQSASPSRELRGARETTGRSTTRSSTRAPASPSRSAKRRS